MKSVRGVASLLLAVTFTVGAFTGMAIEEAAGLDWFDFLDTDLASPETELLAGLTLTAQQRAGVKSIITRQERGLEDYWRAHVPDIDSLLARSYAEIRLLLTPDQQQLFDRRVRELDRQVPREFRD